MTLDIHNKTFGELQVVDKSGKVDGHRRSFWNCRCSCGKSVNVRIDRFMSGKTTSCGHLFSDYVSKRYLGSVQVCEKRIFSHYKGSAKGHGRKFTIPFDAFKHLILQNCYYCGSKPSTEFITSRKSDTVVVLFNGLDRVDNDKGYTVENVVPCCEICNRGKRSMDFSSFTDWISSITGFSLVGMLNKRVEM